MRPAPGPIPDKMPSIEQATKDVTFLTDITRPALMDYSISELVNQYSDGGPKWLVGSTVWLPAVFGQVEKNTDLDVVFQTKDALELFANGTVNQLNRRLTGASYRLTDNGNSGKRILHPNGDHVIDAWHLETDESIAELLMAFPYNYQRCAFFMTWSGSSLGYLTRIVKERTRFRQMEARRGGYGR